VDGPRILGFAERVLPRAADLWVQASLEQRQRLQQLFFPEGIAFDGKAFVRTALTAPAFNWLEAAELAKVRVVAQTCASSNRIIEWLRQIGPIGPLPNASVSLRLARVEYLR
jgi:hypothetical protein